ncbi:MAG: tetratricopeptide repeat protein, partial [Verrucomicrobiae bacterium]|nr:tetratricopeptide repeat protein [Verrucomicrobiae bacterium]
ERYLVNEPVVASPPSALYRLSKFVSRNKIAVTVSAAVGISLLITAISSAMLAYQAKKAANEQRLLREQASLEAKKSGEISEFIKSMFSYVDSLVELQLHNEGNMGVLKEALKETFDRASLRINRLSPDSKIEISDIIGAMYFKIREYASAEMMFRQELALLQAEDKVDHLKLSRTMNHLAAALGRQGKLEEAELHAREALSILNQRFPDESQETARALVNLSAIQVRKAAGSRLSNIQRAELLEQSQISIESALEIQKNILGNEHVEIAATLNELGFVLTCQGREELPRAEAVLTEALAINRKLLGEVNAAVASSVNLLAISQVMQGKYMISLENYKLVQTIRDSLEETKINDVISSYDVSVWEHQNTGQESLDALHDVVELTLLRYGPDSLEAADLYAIEAYTFLEENQFVEAEGKARACLEIRERLNSDDWSPFHARSLLGSALFGQGRLEEAEPFLIEGYEGVKEHRHQLQHEHKIRLNEALLRLIQFYIHTGNQRKAQQRIQEAITLGLKLPDLQAAP